MTEEDSEVHILQYLAVCLENWNWPTGSILHSRSSEQAYSWKQNLKNLKNGQITNKLGMQKILVGLLSVQLLVGRVDNSRENEGGKN